MISCFISLLLIGSCSALRLNATHSTRAYPESDDSVPIHENCKRLVSIIGGSIDFKECQNERSGDYVINNHCLSIQPGTPTIAPEFHTDINVAIGIVTVDDRVEHSGHATWAAYAAKHGYTYIKVLPDPGGLLEKDWSSTAKMREILRNPEYNHINHFMYTELDQWPVQPLAKLEPVFKTAGLVDKKNVMAVVGEYPCDNIRDGGNFNMGNYLFARDERVERLFDDWYNSGAFNFIRSVTPGKANLTSSPQLDLVRYKGALDLPHWPARQGAFSVDVYKKYEDVIYKFASGNPLGSPFGTLVGHVTSGTLALTYDHQRARNLFGLMTKCVTRRLQNDDAKPCSYYPAWVGAPCLICRGSIEVENDHRTDQFPYTGCCGEVDGALPLEAFKIQAEKGEHKPGVEMDLNNIKVIDGDVKLINHDQ